MTTSAFHVELDDIPISQGEASPVRRICATPGCMTVLSQYNQGSRCNVCKNKIRLAKAEQES